MVMDYKERKKEVLDCYERAEDIVLAAKKIAEQRNINDQTEQSAALMKDIGNKVQKVKEDRFSIMVAGEAKSGKSTFINAYLGMDLLPTDERQCTSSLIIIRCGKTFKVTAKYAGKSKDDITDPDEAIEFLKKNASLDDDYRSIPVPTINSDILVREGIISQKKQKAIDIPEGVIADFLKRPEIIEANVDKLSPEEYEKKIRDYINMKKHRWQDIVTQITVEYPFGEDMHGIEIIDSPGVCAYGGVSEITEEHIRHADAVIFLKPLSGTSLVAAPFQKFYERVSANRGNTAIFLVLTRAANVTDNGLKKLQKEAYNSFHELDENHILFIDSKAERYAQNLVNRSKDEVTEYLRVDNRDGELDKFVTTAYEKAYGLFGESNDICKELREMSNFETVRDALEIFGRQSHYLLLGQLLEQIGALYSKLDASIKLQADMYKKKAKDPGELAKQIGQAKRELDDIADKISSGVDKVSNRFRNDVIPKEVEKAVKEFKEDAEALDKNSSSSMDKLKTISIKQISKYPVFVERILREMVEECDKELIVLTDKNVISFEAIKPDFTEEYFKKILEDNKDYATETTYKCFGSIQERKNTPGRYFDAVYGDVNSRLDEIASKNKEDLRDRANKIVDIYSQALYDQMDRKKAEMDDIKNDLASTEHTLETIHILEELLQRMEPERMNANKIKGGIDQCTRNK